MSRCRRLARDCERLPASAGGAAFPGLRLSHAASFHHCDLESLTASRHFPQPYDQAAELAQVLGMLLFAVGMILYGIAALRHQVLPRWNGAPLLIGLLGLALPRLVYRCHVCQRLSARAQTTLESLRVDRSARRGSAVAGCGVDSARGGVVPTKRRASSLSGHTSQWLGGVTQATTKHRSYRVVYRTHRREASDE